MRAEARHRTLSVDLLHDQIQRGLQIRHRDAPVDDHALDLVEHRAVGGVHLVLAVDAARRDDADGQRSRLHRVYLHGRGLRTQEDAAVGREVEGVRPLARGMGFVDIELGKVIVGQLDLRAVDDLKAHADEDILDLVEDVVHRVLVAQALRLRRQRDVHGFGLESALQKLFRQLLAALVESRFDLGAHTVGELAHDRALLRAQGTHLAQDRRELALLAEIADTLRLERFHVGGLRDRPDRRLAQPLHQFFHVLPSL